MGVPAMNLIPVLPYRTDVRAACGRSPHAGFSLIELMVAITLGILLSIGIVTLFGATSTTNNVQDALARLQENGRYAVTRITDDLRMGSGQYCGSSTSQGWTTSTNDGPIYPGLTILSNANGVSTGSAGSFPDSGGLLGTLPGPGTYPVGPASFMQGYDCSTGGGCTPAVPAGTPPNGFPAEGLGDGLRVTGADMLTIRYQRGTGWNFTVDTSGPPHVILAPTIIGGQSMDDPVNFQNNDRALLLTCGGGQVFQVTAAGNNLTPTGLLNSANYKPSATVGSFDVRVFNFSRDFLTVTYYLAYKADPDTAGRLIPTLYRRQNGTQVDELVQGVERLDFIYGVQYKDASLHYLTANQVNANSTSANCSPASPGLGLTAPNVEAGCLWRSVMSIEVHLLLDTVDNIALSPSDMAYRYSGATGDTTMHIPPAPNQPMATGMLAGLMMRREFISSVAMRNGNH
jgi:type IV pilus assembly protein PilW